MVSDAPFSAILGYSDRLLARIIHEATLKCAVGDRRARETTTVVTEPRAVATV